MSVVAAPRVTGGMAASVVLHGGLIAALFFLRPVARPSPPVFKVQIVAAPAGERQAGVVRDTPAPVPETPAPAPVPVSTKTTAPPKKTAANVKSKATAPPKLATPTPAPPPKAADPKTAPAAPTAGGGPTGANGADVASVSTNGIEFPYQPYINNIASQIIRRFSTNARLVAEVRFVIRRDGTVDPDGIKLITPSQVYSFNMAAIGAVEAAAKANAFGPLPQSFREDVLPVTFRFSPTLIK